MVEVAHAHRKPLVANLVGFSSEEFRTLIELTVEAGADMAELNLMSKCVGERPQNR